MNTFEKQECLVCGSPTDLGFIVDKGHYDARRQQEWWSGDPERSFWVGLKKPEETYKITAMRCQKCGFLMSFAKI